MTELLQIEAIKTLPSASYLAELIDIAVVDSLLRNGSQRIDLIGGGSFTISATKDEGRVLVHSQNIEPGTNDSLVFRSLIVDAMRRYLVEKQTRI